MKSTVVSRIWAPMTSAFWCHTCAYVASRGNRDFADEIKVTNQLTLKWGDYPGSSRGLSVIVGA